MKAKISITVDEATLRKVDEGILTGRFRSTSHALEYALRKMLEEEGDGK
ncbi:hypothetical protein HYV86_07885 [Candidatus Woesearchaeota archaeon]|nr:hypothetical protein [Candidatus Woesearchaeota archaeon]